ncbi:MAG: 5-oxoprolinase subunit PxpB [Pyrinomonadaceae bacterium]
MARQTMRIFPLGDSALTVEFGETISIDLNQRAIALADHFYESGFPGFVEAVPAYASASIFYDIIAVRTAFPEFSTAFDAVSDIVRKAIGDPHQSVSNNSRLFEIPVHFNSESALDLEVVGEVNALSTDEVIEIFISREYRVYMLGFLPGFTYMGEVDKRIATPRRTTPRERVPRGSVGIAGSQTGIYSLDSPGGWQIIGRTDVEIFTPNDETPTLLQPGDSVRFVREK